MPIFKTTNDILKTFQEELFDENNNNYNKINLPPSPEWDYSRELNIEDIDIWEVIFEGGGGNGLYAAWCPYAKFFMLRNNFQIETYYGETGEVMLEKRMQELDIRYPRV